MRQYPKQVICVNTGWKPVDPEYEMDEEPPMKGRIYLATGDGGDDPAYYKLQGFEDFYQKIGFVDLDIDEIEITEVQEVLEKRETYIS